MILSNKKNKWKIKSCKKMQEDNVQISKYDEWKMIKNYIFYEILKK